MPPKSFNRSPLLIKPLAQREHDLDLSAIRPLQPAEPGPMHQKMQAVGMRIVKAKRNNSSVIMMMGAHVIRSGVQKYIIDLMKRGYISCLAMNGSGIIHDYEYARIGATTESVARYIKTGEFGLWRETGFLNDVIKLAFDQDPQVGMGEAVGREILHAGFPHKEISLLASACELDIPATIHVGIGYDIIHEHPNCDGAATGALSYNDFLRFAAVIQELEGGVVMNFGSSIMAPEVYLKALSMARNVALQNGGKICNFTTLVCDLHELPEDFKTEAPKDSAAYYFRPWKTMLVRTVADGGESYYARGKHLETVPALWTAINEAEGQ